MVVIFGKALFEKKKGGTLYDFAQHGILRMSDGYGSEYAQVVEWQERVGDVNLAKLKKAAKPVKKAKELSPKEVYIAKTLNLPEFELNTSIKFIDEQTEILRQKLDILGEGRGKKPGFLATPRELNDYISFSESGDVRYGRDEVLSMIERLNNRKNLTLELGEQFNEWPYTSNTAIRDLLSKQKHLEAKLAMGNVPDLPGDAIKQMKNYRELTLKASGKHPVFYLIAPKEDRKAVDRKRDPILLGQSPFGFFWQILGAWDDEVVFLDEL